MNTPDFDYQICGMCTRKIPAEKARLYRNDYFCSKCMPNAFSLEALEKIAARFSFKLKDDQGLLINNQCEKLVSLVTELADHADAVVKSSPLLNTGDQKLLDATQSKTSEGLIPLTPELMQDVSTTIRRRMDTEPAYYQQICDALTSEQRLAVTAWVMKTLCQHAKEGGTYRYLIYDRLGFGPEAYLPLQLAGGLDISNEFDLSEKETWYMLVESAPSGLPVTHIVNKWDAIQHIQSMPEFHNLGDDEAEFQFRTMYMTTKPIELPVSSK